ncbi:hypothetical protein G6F23_013855 [Rhizopus arrhizus]|nr:hypothetical protein G6F23_013855 [Rhizopus arrhizus]
MDERTSVARVARQRSGPASAGAGRVGAAAPASGRSLVARRAAGTAIAGRTDRHGAGLRGGLAGRALGGHGRPVDGVHRRGGAGGRTHACQRGGDGGDPVLPRLQLPVHRAALHLCHRCTAG